MIKKIYIAGPLFNKHEQMYLEDIAKELEGNGYDCFLPHRDQTGIDESELKGTDMSQETKDKIFKNDFDALDAADLQQTRRGVRSRQKTRRQHANTQKAGPLSLSSRVAH